MIEFRGVTKRYPDGTVAVDNLDLAGRDGGITVFVGPSGCGKTTSLRMINRMIDPTSGTILVDGTDVMTTDAAELRRGIGYVIQQAGLFPHRTILDNIATVPLLLGWSKKKARDRAAELMEIVGLDARDGAPLPGAALRRPAAARRRGPRAGRRPAGAADGRAVQRGRPGGPREPAGRAAPAAGRAGQDDRVRHPRHRRGRQARRPGRGVPRRRQAGPVRRARRAARPPGRRLRRRLRRPRPRLPRACLPVLRRASRCGELRTVGAGRAATERRAGCWSSTPTRRPQGWLPRPRRAAATRRRERTWCPAARCTTRAPARCAARWTRRCPRRPGRASRSTATGAVVGSVAPTTCCAALAAARRAEAA